MFFCQEQFDKNTRYTLIINKDLITCINVIHKNIYLIHTFSVLFCIRISEFNIDGYEIK